MKRRFTLGLLALLLPAVLLASAPVHAATAPVSVSGKTTRWTISLAGIRAMNHIPNTTWADRANHWGFYIATVRLTNTGSQVAVPADDLLLTMKVIPPHPTEYLYGWASTPRQKPYVAWTKAAMRLVGGTAPWVAVQPGQTITYCYVFMTARGDKHYGLYNVFLPPGATQHTALNLPRYTYVLDTGM